MQLRNGLIAAAVAAALLCGVPQVQAAPVAATAATTGGASATQIRELMEVAGTKRLMTQMMNQMVGMVTKSAPCVPEAKVRDVFDSPQAQDELIAKMIPVYQQHFTSSDINGLLKFYRSPLGQKMLKTMPVIMQQSMQIGEAWGREHGATLAAELKKEGVLDANGQCKAQQKSVVPAASK